MLNTERILNKIINCERFWITFGVIMFLVTWFLGV